MISDIILATNKVNFGNYEKLFQHFGFGDDHLLREAILANILRKNSYVLQKENSQISRKVLHKISKNLKLHLKQIKKNIKLIWLSKEPILIICMKLLVQKSNGTSYYICQRERFFLQAKPFTI